MSSQSQTISKLKYLLIVTFPFLASDSVPSLHFQLACNWYTYYSSEELEQKVRSEEGAFSGTSAASEMESLSAAFYLK